MERVFSLTVSHHWSAVVKGEQGSTYHERRMTWRRLHRGD